MWVAISTLLSTITMVKQKNNTPSVAQQNNTSEQLISAQWEGPLPPPSTLADFNSIIENGAERIVTVGVARFCQFLITGVQNSGFLPPL